MTKPNKEIENILGKYRVQRVNSGDSPQDGHEALTIEIVELIQSESRKAVERCVNELSDKPKCTESEPCGCHFGEVFHADGVCACDLVEKFMNLPKPSETGVKD